MDELVDGLGREAIAYLHRPLQGARQAVSSHLEPERETSDSSAHSMHCGPAHRRGERAAAWLGIRKTAHFPEVS